MHEKTSLRVQRFLRAGGTIEGLASHYQIRDTGDEKLAYLSYGISADFTNPMVRECRSLVLERNTWNVVAMTFEKFGNEGESYAVTPDPNDTIYVDKLDGSLITVDRKSVV